jgi:hypothetical protein
LIDIIEIYQDLSSKEKFDRKEFVLGKIESDNITIAGQINSFELIIGEIDLSEFRVVH